MGRGRKSEKEETKTERSRKRQHMQPRGLFTLHQVQHAHTRLTSRQQLGEKSSVNSDWDALRRQLSFSVSVVLSYFKSGGFTPKEGTDGRTGLFPENVWRSASALHPFLLRSMKNETRKQIRKLCVFSSNLTATVKVSYIWDAFKDKVKLNFSNLFCSNFV